MAYSQLATDDTATSHSHMRQSAFPPGYEDLESGNGFQNYVHLSTKDSLITTLLVDTDLPPVFGRFADEEEQKAAKNVSLRAKFMNVTVRLKGSAKAKLEMRGDTMHRRVLQIEQSQTSTQTQFTAEVFNQGRNAIIVVPEDFSGAIAGRVTLSPMLKKRSTCLVQDEEDLNKTRYTVAALPGQATSNNDETLLSSVSNIIEKVKPGQLNGKCYVCCSEEYMLDESEKVLAEGEKALRLESSFWPVKFLDFWRRLFLHGTTGDKIALSFAAGMTLFMFCIVALGFYVASTDF